MGKQKMRQRIIKIIERYSDTIFFLLPLSLFALVGFVALYYAMKFPTNVPFFGWVTILLFIIIPLVLLYGFVFGFTISEKKQKQIEDRKNSLSFNDEGILIAMPLFDKNCFVSWKSIDAIIYYNYYVSSDFTEHYEGYKLYLNIIPIYTKYEKQWWLNKLFSKDSKSKIVDVKSDTKYFVEMPKMIENYLKLKVAINFDDPMKGTLMASETYQSKTTFTTIEKWKPNNAESEQIVYNKFDRKIEEIRKDYH